MTPNWASDQPGELHQVNEEIAEGNFSVYNVDDVYNDYNTLSVD